MKKKESKRKVGGTHPESPLQCARIKAGVSQDEVAKALDCEIRTVQRYEAGKQSPTQEMLLIMKDLFHCEIADLFPKEALPKVPDNKVSPESV